MACERGLSAVTIQRRLWYIDQFLRWYGDRHSCLAEVRLEDIDTFLTMRGNQGWSRLSVRNLAAALRVFFRYAGAKGWCQAAMAEAIEAPPRQWTAERSQDAELQEVNRDAFYYNYSGIQTSVTVPSSCALRSMGSVQVKLPSSGSIISIGSRT